jgi:hypothetical protein
MSKKIKNKAKVAKVGWRWLKWKQPTKPWAAQTLRDSTVEQQLFRVCTEIKLGNGQHTSFWHDRSLHGSARRELAPALLRFAWKKT